MWIVQAIMIGILITAPTGLAILICSRGNAADRSEIARLTNEIERLERRHRADTTNVLQIYADHEAEIAGIKERHEAEMHQMSDALNEEFTRGIDWERKRPQREARSAKWAAQMMAEHANYVNGASANPLATIKQLWGD